MRRIARLVTELEEKAQQVSIQGIPLIYKPKVGFIDVHEGRKNNK